MIYRVVLAFVAAAFIAGCAPPGTNNVIEETVTIRKPKALPSPTTHSEPTYIVDDVVHYCVTNMPGAVGRTSTYALCNVTFPYALRIADQGIHAACAADPGLAEAVNMYGGKLTNRPVADTFGMPCETYACS